jgi:hypothetical protein
MEQPVAGPPAWYDWNGTRWYRNNPGYYIDVGGTRRRLHIAIWEAANGRPLPAGHIVRHVNHDKGDNDPGNLQAVTRADHNRHHQSGAVRDAAARARIRAGILEAWAGREPRTLTCERCGTQFQTLSTRKAVRFCGKSCQSRSRREELGGLPAWERVRVPCPQCGIGFEPKDRNTRFCTRSCAEAFYRDARAEGRPLGRL